MGRKNVPIKTDEGVLEIKSRALGLAPRIRTALLLVDGMKSTAELERIMSAAGVTPGALQLLLDKGLIRFPEEERAHAEFSSAPVTLPEMAPEVVLDAAPIDASTNKPDKPVVDVEKKRSAKPTLPTKPQMESPAPTVTVTPVAEETASASVVLSEPVVTPKPQIPPTRAAALEVAALPELETILGVATELEMETILGVATMLELTPTPLLAPKTKIRAPVSNKPRLPPLARAEHEYRSAEVVQEKTVSPASVLRMNLLVARAHLAGALDQFLGIDGYLLKQKVVACESRDELEQFFRLVEGALLSKIDKPAVARVIRTAQAVLAR